MNSKFVEVIPLCFWLGIPYSIYPFASQGLREIWIGIQLQEAGMRHWQSGWGKMSVALAGSDTEYLMEMLEEMFRAPVFSEIEDKAIRLQMTKRVASEPASHPGPSKLPKCSKVKDITLLGFPIETDFGIGGMINKLERVEGKSISFCHIPACNKPPQNRTTLINHIRKDHLNQKLRCPLCQYTC